VADAEGGEAREVDGRGEHREVARDALGAAHARASPAVPSSHEVRELALDLRAGGSVARAPLGTALAGAGALQHGLVRVDRDLAAAR
jgi:hypothetical protein